MHISRFESFHFLQNVIKIEILDVLIIKLMTNTTKLNFQTFKKETLNIKLNIFIINVCNRV